MKLNQSPLGKPSSYVSNYDKSFLFRFKREERRKAIDVDQNNLPFTGYDIVNAYEVSWLDNNNKPIIKIVEFMIPAESEYLVENKSLKLYLHSFNNSQFDNENVVCALMQKDLSEEFGCEIIVNFYDVTHQFTIRQPSGINIDNHQVTGNFNEVLVSKLQTTDNIIEETLNSNLLKSNCLMTNQPDWGTLEISYLGPKIDQVGLLEYIISYRDQQTFMEQCIERIFMDIMRKCKPSKLTVYGRFCRRGGIDINAFRTTEKNLRLSNDRFSRQ